MLFFITNVRVFFFFFFFFFFWGGGVLEMPDIFWGGPSDQIFFGGTEQMLGPSLYAYKQMFRVSPPPWAPGSEEK